MTTILTHNYVVLTFIEYFCHALFEKKKDFQDCFSSFAFIKKEKSMKGLGVLSDYFIDDVKH